MSYKKIIQHIEEMNSRHNDIEPIIERLFAIKMRYLNKNFKRLSEYKKSIGQTGQTLTHIYFMVSEDIIKNLYFNFPESKTKFEIIKLFKYINNYLHTIKETDDILKITKQKAAFVEADIDFFYNDSCVSNGIYDEIDFPTKIHHAMQQGYEWADTQYHHIRIKSEVEEYPSEIIKQMSHDIDQLDELEKKSANKKFEKFKLSLKV